MKTLAYLLAFLALCSPAFAQDAAVVLDLTGVKPGSYLVTIDAQGVVKAVPLRVIKIGKPSVPPPVDPPTNPELTKFEQEISKLTQAALASGGTKTTGAGLSSVYSLVSSSVSDGSIAPAKAFEAVKKASDSVIAVQADGAKWAAFRKSVGDALTKLAGDGAISNAAGELDKAKVAGVLQEIANGMNAATGFSGNPAEVANLDPATTGILDGIDLAKLIELIKLIMELLKLFGA